MAAVAAGTMAGKRSESRQENMSSECKVSVT